MVNLRAFKGTADLYFIRHGESEGNRDGIIQGRIPSRLTETGREQARAAGEWFKDKGIELVLTSPLTRAAETAALVADGAGAPSPEIGDDLTEIGTGIFSGLSFAEARARHPDAWREFQRHSWEAVPEAERIETLLRRAERIWAHLAARAAEGRTRILCVTHSGFLQWIIRATFGGRTWMPLISASDNCCVSHLRVSNTAENGEPTGHMASWIMINAAIDGSPPGTPSS